MKKLKSRGLVLAAALAASLMAKEANAAALVNLTIQGSTDGSTWSSSLSNLTSGQNIQIRVVGVEAPVGTVNNQSNKTVSSTAIGINSLAFDLNDSDGGAFGSQQLGTGWGNGTGASFGAVSGQSLVDIFAAQAAGVFTGAPGNQVTVLSGTFTVGSASTETLSGAWDLTTGHSTGSFRTGSTVSTNVGITSTTETSSDPYVSFAPLSLSLTEASPVPSPSIAGASSLLLVGFGLLQLARRRKIA